MKIISEPHVCRLCREDGRFPGMIKYGVRHYAHFACYLDAEYPLEELSAWQVKQFPYQLLARHGLIDRAARIVFNGE